MSGTTDYSALWEKQRSLGNKIKNLSEEKFKKLRSKLENSSNWEAEVSGGAFNSYNKDDRDSLVMWVMRKEIIATDYNQGKPEDLEESTDPSKKVLNLYAKLLGEVEDAFTKIEHLNYS